MTREKRNKETGCTNREELFAQYLISEPDMDEITAYTKAGFSADSAYANAYRCKERPHVKAYINKLKAERSKRMEITADDVLKDLITIKDRCMQAVEVSDKEGKSTGEWKFDAANAIKAIENVIKHFVIVPKDNIDEQISTEEVKRVIKFVKKIDG